MYDVIVVGGGPAAFSASINLKIRNKSFIVLAGNEKITGLTKAPHIDNYPGMPGISGKGLLDAYRNHSVEMGVEIKNQKVYNILSMGDYYAINVGNEFYEAKSIILATGQERHKYLAGEKEYLGNGVGYCATCDGPLYRDKTVAIVSENEEGEEEANFLSEICAQVFYIPLYKKEFKLNDSVKLINEKAVEVVGDGSKATGLKTEFGTLDVDAVFIIRNVIPVNQLIEGVNIEEASIKVDRNMSTNIPGVFACGDCTGKPYQVAKAAGEGNVAALGAVKYLDTQK